MPIKPKSLPRPWNKYKQRPQKMELRPRSRDEYHTARWTRESKAFRETHPLCVGCLEKGIIKPAEVVDHIIPVDVCADFWYKPNWQSLCQKCNIEKGNKDKKMIRDGRNNAGNHTKDQA